MGIRQKKDIRTRYFGNSISDYAIIGGLVVSFGAGAFYVFGLSFQEAVSNTVSPMASSHPIEVTAPVGIVLGDPGVNGGNGTSSGGNSGGSNSTGALGTGGSSGDVGGTNGTGGYDGGGISGGGTAGGGSGQGFAGTVLRGGSDSSDSWFNPSPGGDNSNTSNGDTLVAPLEQLGGNNLSGDLDPENLPTGASPADRGNMQPAPAPSLPPAPRVQ